MFTTAWSRVLLLSAATLFLSTEAVVAKNERAFGAKAPFEIGDLPPGILRNQLEGLPAAAQQRALGWLHRFDFTKQDVPTLRTDPRGGIFYEDPLFRSHNHPHDYVHINDYSTSSVAESGPGVEEITFSDAFSLHSKPGASRTVYLDMDGHVVTGTAWNGSGDPLYMRPYDTDGDESSFSQSELNDIAETWKRVAEDFAPYDIDVTTEQPPSFGPNVGHILVTFKADENNRLIYNCSCGGVAYVGVWGLSNFTYYQPALVFLDGVGGPHNVSEAASHELGHNLNLSHDGTSSVGYYRGHGSGYIDWGPIMGVGYYAQVSQWSKGEYADANNTQDDLQIIAGYLGYRSDDHEDVNFASATPLQISNGVDVLATNPVTDPANLNPANKGIIEHRSDKDLFYMDVGAGVIDLTITPAWIANYSSESQRGMNLDVQATLYDAAGYQVVQSNPAADTYAQINVNVGGGRYYLEIDGVGVGDPLTNGYTDYGSLGQYFISGTVPEDQLYTAAPTAPDDLSAAAVSDADIQLTWTDPASTLDTNETAYRVYRQKDSGSFVQIATLGRDSSSYADNNLASGSYVYQVEPYNSVGGNISNATQPIVITVPTSANATAEFTSYGAIVSGSYLNTVNAADSERLSEQHQGGRPRSRISQLDHSWTVTGIEPGATVTLKVRAETAYNSEGDDFLFAYALNGGAFQPLGTLEGGTGVTDFETVLPAGTTGTLELRVTDTDRTAGNGQNDALDVYLIEVVSAGLPGNLPPEVSILEPVDSFTAVEGDSITFSATANDPEDGDLATSLQWLSDLDNTIGTGGSFSTSILSVGTHQVTAQVQDSASMMGSDTITVVINSATTPNNPPVATDDDVTMDQDTSANIAVLDNDTDVDGDSLSIASAGGASNGSVSHTDSTVIYTPTSGFNGTDSFTYTVIDGLGGSDTATVTVTVNPVSGGALAITSLTPSTIGTGTPETVEISGSGFQSGATLSFINGSGPTPQASNLIVDSASMITVDIFVKNGGPRRTRSWDVVITNPGGASATCSGCLTVQP